MHKKNDEGIKLSVPDSIIPAFPYEGAIYWLFSGRGTESYQGSHEYYMSLYGPDHDKLVPRATALAALFDRLILAPADANLPDYTTCLSGGNYEHPDLRISMSWEIGEWDKENVSIAELLLRTNSTKGLLNSIPLLASSDEIKRHFLCRTLLQIRLAYKHGGILVGDSFFNKVHDNVMSIIGTSLIPPRSDSKARTWELNPSTLTIVGLDLPAESIDTFACIRQSKEISTYAREFRTAISSAMDSQDLTNTLLNLMRKAMGQDETRKYMAGGFQTVGSVANVFGLIPIIGSFASGTGIGADLANRTLEKSSIRKQWYLLGPKMREVAIKSLLSRKNQE